MKNDTTAQIRQVHGAGRWFPQDENQLRDMVEGFINEANVPPVSGKIAGAIAPHAGYIYSGDIAGHTFSAIKKNANDFPPPETVVVLGFSHSRSFPGAALMDGSAIQTPLGVTAIDNESNLFLANTSPLIRPDYTPHQMEHSAENLVPFVQSALPEAQLVVALTGTHDNNIITGLANSLDALSKEKSIIVIASTDMLHSPDYELVTRTDKATLELVAAMDFSAVSVGWSYDHQIFCGITPVLTTMAFAEMQGCGKGVVAAYKNSGDDFPESRGEWVVGYGSAVFV